MSNEVLNSGKSQASTIDKFQINSNKSGQVDLTGGITVRLRYYESILEPTVRVTVQYTDTGSSYEDKTVLEGPIVGTEKCNIKDER